MDYRVCSSTLSGPFWDGLLPQWKGDQNKYGTVGLFGTPLTVEMQIIVYGTVLNRSVLLNGNGA